MSLPLVIGIGNPTRSDDGAGHAVVFGLSRLVPDGTYRAVHQLTPDLAEDLAEASLVVFVDASVRATTLQLVPVEPTPVAPGSHITTAGAQLEQRGFFEREVARRTERFGNLVHAWSTYESRKLAEDPAPFQRGINSIQMRFDGTRWWVLTIAWQGETPDSPIPALYLESEHRP